MKEKRNGNANACRYNIIIIINNIQSDRNFTATSSKNVWHKKQTQIIIIILIYF